MDIKPKLHFQNSHFNILNYWIISNLLSAPITWISGSSPDLHTNAVILFLYVSYLIFQKLVCTSHIVIDHVQFTYLSDPMNGLNPEIKKMKWLNPKKKKKKRLEQNWTWTDSLAFTNHWQIRSDFVNYAENKINILSSVKNNSRYMPLYWFSCA